jgi:hypothetical protein
MRASPWALALLFCASTAWAEDGPKPATPTDEVMAKVVEIEASVAQHKKDKDEGALTRDLDAIAALHKDPASVEKHEARLNALIGTVLAGPKSDGFEKAAIKVIGDIGDEANFKYIRKHLIQGDPKTVPPLMNDAIEAAGKLKASGAVDLLLKIVDDSKVFPPSAAAMRALGNYGSEKRLRTKILAAMVDSTRRSVPGGRGMSKGGSSDDGESGGSTKGTGGDASRWGAIAPAFVEAANNLTGKTASSPEDWFSLYDRYKTRLDDLFEK